MASSPTPYEMVAEFHQAFGLPVRTQPTQVAEAERDLRIRLLVEETGEFLDASIDGGAVLAGELADCLIVAYGTALYYGLDCEALALEAKHKSYGELTLYLVRLMNWMYDYDEQGILDELAGYMARLYVLADQWEIDLDKAVALVHQANMRKLGPDGEPILRADGKVLKPDGWVPADLTGSLR
jgi:predicted HAD superfamily Cof-like phosphohydrolase